MTDVAETAATPEPAPLPSPDLPIHQGTCQEAGCPVGATYRPTASGTGFTVLERVGVAIDHTFGAGPNGRPICPHGHGELTIADDLLPASEAITEVAKQVAPRLPFPAPVFNYEGALHQIFEKRKDVAKLEMRFNDADERRKKAKAALDIGNVELGEMIDAFQDREDERNHEIARREAQVDAGHPEDTNLVRCTWEQAHPDEDCPVCADQAAADGRGCGDTARDSVLHVEAVDRLIRLVDTDEITELVRDAGIRLEKPFVHALTDEHRTELRRWAEGVDPRPAFLGTAHIAAAGGDDTQACGTCGAVLLAVLAADGVEAYPVGALVGVDCPGIEKVEGQHYPEKRGKGRANKA